MRPVHGDHHQQHTARGRAHRSLSAVRRAGRAWTVDLLLIAAIAFAFIAAPHFHPARGNDGVDADQLDQPRAGAVDGVRFLPIEVYIDPAGRPLAAWQIEFRAPEHVSIVGIENGGHAAFADEPPHYDPAAMMNRRVLLAQYSLAEKADLPAQRVRITTLHLRIEGALKPEDVAIDVIAAAEAGGERIEVEVEVSFHIGDES